MKNYFGIVLVFVLLFSGVCLADTKQDSAISKHFKALFCIQFGSGLYAGLAHKNSWQTQFLSHTLGIALLFLGTGALAQQCRIDCVCDETKHLSCNSEGIVEATAGLHLAGICIGYLSRPIVRAFAKKIIHLCAVK